MKPKRKPERKLTSESSWSCGCDVSGGCGCRVKDYNQAISDYEEWLKSDDAHCIVINEIPLLDKTFSTRQLARNILTALTKEEV